MKTRIYLGEWFLNAGIIGFIRILKHNGNDFTQKKQNYIEFDTKELQNFHEYYFQYFYDNYNIGNKTKERIEKAKEKIESLITNRAEKKEEIKKNQDQLKAEKKYLKTIIKTQMDKIKKFEENAYQNILEAYNQIDSIKEPEDTKKLEEVTSQIIQNIQEDKINKRLTMNLFKSILSKNYFGQPSFLNVVKTGLSFEEQQKIMYKDYLSNIIENDFLQEIVEGKYDQEELKNKLEEKEQNALLTNEITRVYANIKKQLEKGNSIEKIGKYITEKVLTYCQLCEHENQITSNYSEGNFIPLAVSSDNMRNFFWNQNANLPICELCKLMLFCTPAGITSITKTVKENSINGIMYQEKEIYSFINYDTDINTLLQTNDYFGSKTKRDKNTQANPYTELIMNIVEQDKKISEWQLQNIFVVEFESEYLAYSRMEYFQIKRHVAKFFKRNAESTLNKISDYRYRLNLVDYILKDKDITIIINERLREELRKEKRNGTNHLLAIKTKTDLELLKKEGQDVGEKMKSANAKIHVMFTIGNEIYEKLRAENSENKLDSYIYKMLNSIKGNRKDEFIDVAIRLIWSEGKDIPELLVIKNEEVDWKDIGHSFIAGLTQPKYVKNKEENGNG